MKKILIISNASMEMIVETDRLPLPEETLLGNFSHYFLPGGKGSLSSIAVARLGGDVALCTRLGADNHGQRLMALYTESGVDTRFIPIDKTANTGFNLYITERNGTTRSLQNPGASYNLSRADVEQAFLCLPDAVYLQFEIPFDVACFASEIAAEKGIPVFVDASGVRKTTAISTLAPLEVFSPNEKETELLTGVTPIGIDGCLRACIELGRRVKAKYYVLKLGNRGAFIYDGRFCHMAPAYPLRNAVDTAAAGDAFSAAMTLEYLRNGKDIRQACLYANAAAALTISRPGTTASLPTADEVAAFMRENPAP